MSHKCHTASENVTLGETAEGRRKRLRRHLVDSGDEENESLPSFFSFMEMTLMVLKMIVMMKTVEQ